MMKVNLKWGLSLAVVLGLILLVIRPNNVLSKWLMDYTGPQNRSYTESVEVDRYCRYVYYWNGAGVGCWNGSTFNSSCSIHTRDAAVLASNCGLDIPNGQVSSICGCTAPDWKPWNGEPDPELVRVMDTNTINLPPATVSGVADCDGTVVGDWCTGQVSVEITGVEPVSAYSITGIESNTGWSSGGESATFDAPEGETDFEFWAVSSYGDTSLKGTATLKQDTLPPTYSVSVTAANGAGWYNLPVTIILSGEDSGSGIAVVQITESGTATMLLDVEGIYALNYFVADNVGWSVSGNGSFQLDFTPPTITTSFPAPDGANGWYVTPPTLSVSGTDVLSGIASEIIAGYGSNTTTLSDGIHSDLEFKVTDLAGNEVSESHSFMVDSSLPILSVSHDAASALLTGGIVNFSGSATDGLSGLTLVEVVVDGSTQMIVPDASGFFAHSLDFDPLADGSHSIQFGAQDAAGNLSTQTFSFTKDSSPPTISLPSSWKLGQSVLIQVQDTTSGVNTCSLTISRDAHTWSTTFTGMVDTSFLWDGIYSDGSPADYGNHAVSLNCEDRAGLLSSTTAVISNPRPPTPTPTNAHLVVLYVPTQTPSPSATLTSTPTAMPTSTATATGVPTEAIASQTVIPTLIKELALIEPVSTATSVVPALTETPAGEKHIFSQKELLITSFCSGLIMLACFALYDPRPSAWFAVANLIHISTYKDKLYSGGNTYD